MAETITLQVSGMHCASCVGRAEKALLAQPGVVSAAVNLATGTAFVASQSAQGALLAGALSDAGYPAKVQTDPMSAHSGADIAHEFWMRFVWAAVLTLPVFLVEMGGHAFPVVHHWVATTIGQTQSWILQFLLITCVLAGPGRAFFTDGFTALRRSGPDMNTLVALGAGSAWVYSSVVTFVPDVFPAVSQVVYFEASGVIVTLILLGRALEARAKGKAGAAVRALIGLQPDTAIVRRGDQWEDCPLDQVTQGDVLLARPGARIAVDGVVVSGQGFVDEAMLTGEPVPSGKTSGGTLFAGTINGTSALEYRATGVGAQTYLARIVDMVTRAQGAKLPVQALIDRITAVFVPAVMVLSALSFVGWLVLGGTLAQAFVAAVSVLIIACPCAMGLATPVSVVVATGRAAQIGGLFRNGGALESLSRITTIAFDKTGTLTAGAPTLVSQMFSDPGVSLADVAAVEVNSEHPLAQAIVRASNKDLPTASDFEAAPGHGVSAQVQGVRIAVGSGAYMEKLGIDVVSLAGEESRLLSEGTTPVFVARNGQAAGLLGISDPVRPEAADTLRRLKNAGVKLALISGDRFEVAKRVGTTLGIETVYGDVLPEDKQDIVRALRTDGVTAFVGDGINDSPALAEADVGIAMGQGTDVAIETADLVLMGSDIQTLPKMVHLGKAMMRNIRQNLFWAFAYNVALIPVAAGVFYPVAGWQLSPMLGAGAMALSSVFVVTNALRLRSAV